MIIICVHGDKKTEDNSFGSIKRNVPGIRVAAAVIKP